MHQSSKLDVEFGSDFYNDNTKSWMQRMFLASQRRQNLETSVHLFFNHIQGNSWSLFQQLNHESCKEF